MPHLNISDLKEGAVVKQFFLVRQAEDRRTREGKRYRNLKLCDRTGVIAAKIWEEALKKSPGPVTPCDFVGVRGKVEAYQGELQLNLDYVETVEKIRARAGDLSGFDPELLVLASGYDREEMWRELKGLAESHLQEPLRALVLALLDRYQDRLKDWPGAEALHHAYVGGLLEHTWTAARLAVRALEVYPALNQDLVLAGVILHDLGKIKELADPHCPRRTAAGGLLGHIVLGWEMVREEARAMSFPDKHLLMELEHILISHHGAEEFGSPVLPKTPEALLVYYLDEIDAKLHMAERHLLADASEGYFTSRHWALDRRLYKGGGPEDQEEPPPSD